jgi:hypothetical protein
VHPSHIGDAGDDRVQVVHVEPFSEVPAVESVAELLDQPRADNRLELKVDQC